MSDTENVIKTREGETITNPPIVRLMFADKRLRAA